MAPNKGEDLEENMKIDVYGNPFKTIAKVTRKLTCRNKASDGEMMIECWASFTIRPGGQW